MFIQCFRITDSQNFPVDCSLKITEHLFMFVVAMTYYQKIFTGFKMLIKHSGTS